LVVSGCSLFQGFGARCGELPNTALLDRPATEGAVDLFLWKWNVELLVVPCH
jgi:hypothetical protein